MSTKISISDDTDRLAIVKYTKMVMASSFLLMVISVPVTAAGTLMTVSSAAATTGTTETHHGITERHRHTMTAIGIQKSKPRTLEKFFLIKIFLYISIIL